MKIQIKEVYCKVKMTQSEFRALKLFKELQDFAKQYRTHVPDLTENAGYTLAYNYRTDELEIGAAGNWLTIGDITFETEEIAQLAIEQFESELMWYFNYIKTTF